MAFKAKKPLKPAEKNYLSNLQSKRPPKTFIWLQEAFNNFSSSIFCMTYLSDAFILFLLSTSLSSVSSASLSSVSSASMSSVPSASVSSVFPPVLSSVFPLSPSSVSPLSLSFIPASLAAFSPSLNSGIASESLKVCS